MTTIHPLLVFGDADITNLQEPPPPAGLAMPDPLHLIQANPRNNLLGVASRGRVEPVNPSATPTRRTAANIVVNGVGPSGRQRGQHNIESHA
jgi:hypothetical protein